jgi:hypothetical protein
MPIEQYTDDKAPETNETLTYRKIGNAFRRVGGGLAWPRRLMLDRSDVEGQDAHKAPREKTRRNIIGREIGG